LIAASPPPSAHGEIHHNHGRSQVPDQLDCGLAVAGFADDLDVRLSIEQRAQPGTEHGVIVRQDDRDLVRLCH
jgi:hypothetical protein